MSIEEIFPNLRMVGFRETSPATKQYNCVAWAAGCDDAWWEPLPGYYWPGPDKPPQLGSVRVIVRMFKELGFRPCKSAKLQDGYEKIAIYGVEWEYTHAARQLPNGKWTSKLGENIDCEHDELEGLMGSEYGSVVQIMRRRIKSATDTKSTKH